MIPILLSYYRVQNLYFVFQLYRKFISHFIIRIINQVACIGWPIFTIKRSENQKYSMILKYDFENNFNFSQVLGVNLCQFEFVCKIHYNFELRRSKIEYKI